MSYYDGTKLLSLLDINGKKPEIYMVTTNRTGGKTTWFSSFLVRKFIKKKEKFMLLYRFNYELSDCAEKFFKDIHNLYFNDYNLRSQCRAKGMFHELFLNDEPCGYAVALNNADTLKKYSHLFNDVERMFFDEFQSEMNKYCTDEIRKLLSIHTSVARGRGKQVRYVPVYMCGNTVSLLNPYYTAMGISDRLMTDTKFLKGDGFVMEQGFIESGRGRYLATVKYLNKHYAIYDYDSLGILYVTDSYDSSFPYRLCLTTDDHNINYVMLSKNSLMINNYRMLFNRGCFRFRNLDSKQMLLKLLSY